MVERIIVHSKFLLSHNNSVGYDLGVFLVYLYFNMERKDFFNLKTSDRLKKLFKFLKKVIIILEAVISLFFMFKTARFLLSLGYVARYAPSKNNKTFHF